MSTFLSYFNIPLDQVSVDFLNLDLEKDTEKFIDSYYLSQSSNNFCIEALETQKIFMSELMTSLKESQINKTYHLCSNFKEPKCTGIGLSIGSYDGRGSAKIKVEKIIEALKTSKAAQTGLLTDLEELILVLKNIGADTISDITTNICMKSFAQYTVDQCSKLNIPIKETEDYLNYFCKTEKKWKKEKFKLPHVLLSGYDKESPIVLMPNEILDDLISYNSTYFFTNTASPVFAENAIRMYPTASFIYSVKSTKERKVNLTDLRQLHPEYRNTKENIDRLITEKPELLTKYRNTVALKRYKDRKTNKK